MPAPITAAESAGDGYTSQSGNSGYHVENYDLSLRYKMSNNRLTGVARITIIPHAPLSRFSFDLIGLGVSKVRVDGKRARIKQTHAKLRISPPVKLKMGVKTSIVVEYEGAPGSRRSEWGRIGWEELDDGIIVASQPTGAPTWFPCNDHPSNKATYQIQFETDQPYVAVCTGRLVDYKTASGRGVWQYIHDEPTASYLVAVQVGRFVRASLSQGSPQIYAYYPRSNEKPVRHDLIELPRMMAIFEKYFGRYPFSAYTVVVTADQLEIPLEAQGLAVFGSNHADGSSKSERLVAHELAHQWFGNSIGLRRWQDIWLNEGFACYSEWIWAEEAGRERLNTLARRHYLRLKALPQDIIVSDPGANDMFDDRVYKRGALTIHAVRAVLGTERFFHLIRAWTTQYRHSTATTDEFIELAVSFASAKTNEEELLRRAFTEWLNLAPLPAYPT